MTSIASKKGFSAVSAIALVLAAAPAGAIDPQAAGAQPASAPVLSAAGGRSGGFMSGVFGCAASGNKQTIGAVAGGVLGGFLGNRIAGRGSRWLGTIIGGALGAAGGSLLGCKLQKNDQAKAERAVEDAVATNSNQSWKSDETGASGTVEVGQSGTALSDLKFANGVEPASGYTRVGASYLASANANVRGRPGLDGAVVGQIPSGARVWVPASVKGAPWLLISEGGVAQGYVSNALLKPAPQQTASNCKVVKQTINQPGAPAESETLQACKDANGQWTMTRV